MAMDLKQMFVRDENISVTEVKKTLLPTCIPYSPIAFLVGLPYGPVHARRRCRDFPSPNSCRCHGGVFDVSLCTSGMNISTSSTIF